MRAASGFLALSAPTRALLADAVRVARFDVPVLIEGETGCGKELLARHLHASSPRRRRPLTAVNCAAIPAGLIEAEFFGHARGAFTGAEASRAGLIEAADRGTLFLDEVGELSPRGQSLLLRALQEREYRRVGETRVRRADFRLVAATHRPLEALAAAGKFRADLFYRLRVVSLHIPPLRERPEEIPGLADALLQRLARRYRLHVPRLSSGAVARLAAHDWPGNVRELESALAAALLRHPERARLGAEMFPFGPAATNAGPDAASSALLEELLRIRRLAEARETLERVLILRALARAAGNRARAARELGISRQGLWKKLRRYDIG